MTNDPHEREKVSVIPRFFASLAGFSVATFGLYIINYLNKVAGESNLYAEKGYTLFAIIIAVIFIVTIGITVFNVKEESTLGVSSEKTSLKQAFQVIVKNDQLLAFIGLLLTFNLLEDERFFIVSRGVLCNMDEIADFTSCSCTLACNVTVPVTKRNAKQLQQAWRDYEFAKIHKLTDERSIR